MANKIVSFVGETKSEVKKVTWPTRQELIGSTAVVLLTTSLLAVFLGFFDYLFSILIKFLLH